MFGRRAFSYDTQFYINDVRTAGGGETGGIIPVGSHVALRGTEYKVVRVVVDGMNHAGVLVPVDVYLVPA